MVVKRPRKSPRVDLANITIIFEYLHDVRCGVNVSDKKSAEEYLSSCVCRRFDKKFSK